MTDLTVLHYNDVYNVEAATSKEPIGGAARFVTALRSFESLNPLILFSGDIFSPSMLSTFTKGEQMVPVLNATNTACAVFGNHDFDHGLDVLTDLIKNTTFPWLMSNVIDNETGKPLGNGAVKHILDHEGFKVGLIGLVEKEWLETLPTIDPKSVTFIDYVEAGTNLAAELKDNENCDIVIALTHMRTPNDRNLAKNCPRIDLVLGGHDHVYEVIDVDGIKIIKSGTDFRQFSKLTIKKDRLPNGKIDISVETVDVTSDFPEDQKLKSELEKYTAVIADKMKEELGTFSVELDGRFSKIRTEETNLGDWVCDVVLAATGVDIVMINSGTFRSDQIHPPGPFLMKDLVNIIPMRDPLVLLEISGKCLKAAVENSVSGYPKLEGRFPQVSGISFAFDPSKEPFYRVDERLIFIGDELFNEDQTYKICIKSYMHGGCDGYSMFKDAKVLLDDDACPDLSQTLQDHFRALKNNYKNKNLNKKSFKIEDLLSILDDDSCPELGLAIQNHFKAINMKHDHLKTKHRQSLVTISRRSSMCQMFEQCEELDGPCPIRKLSKTQWKTFDHCDSTNNNSHQNGDKEKSPRPPMTRRASVQEYEEITCQLAPKTQQRVIRIRNVEHFNELLVQAHSFKNLSLNDSIIEEASE